MLISMKYSIERLKPFGCVWDVIFTKKKIYKTKSVHYSLTALGTDTRGKKQGRGQGYLVIYQIISLGNVLVYC